MTSSDQGKCGLTSLLPMSCRGRAEAFARRLQSRLNSLGSHNGSTSPSPTTTTTATTTKEIVDETSWLTAKRSDNNTIALSQPRTSADTDLFFDLNLLESPGSPIDEVDNTDRNRLEKLLNHDNLQLPHSEDCHCLGNEKNYKKLIDSNSVNDSDSSDIFYDTENDVPTSNSENTNGIDCHDDNDDDDVFVTTSECTLQPSASLSNEDSASLHTNESLSELPQDIETYTNRLTVDKDMTVEITDPSPTSIITNNNNQDDSGNGEDYDDDDDDDEENEMRLPRVRRCSSLKTGKTPPGTPGRKKIVRFADVLGLDLADVRTFLDEIPKIPISAYDDLKDVELSNDNDQQVNNCVTNNKVDRILMPLFQQPGGLPNFLDRIRDNCVCLEGALVKDPIELSISGTVRVRNLDFHKSVHIRYTLDGWQSFADVKANYVENSCDGFSDKFTFLMYANTLSIGQRLEFAVRFQCKGCQYWDNNNGVNYCFQCLPATNTTNCFRPITSRLDDGWSAGFYYGDDDGDDTDEINKEPDELVTSKAVQEFILNTLETKSSSVKQPTVTRAMKKKSDILTLFIIMIISIIFMYLQKAIS